MKKVPLQSIQAGVYLVIWNAMECGQEWYDQIGTHHIFTHHPDRQVAVRLNPSRFSAQKTLAIVRAMLTAGLATPAAWVGVATAKEILEGRRSLVTSATQLIALIDADMKTLDNIEPPEIGTDVLVYTVICGLKRLAELEKKFSFERD